jgi:hypothetical protein
MQSESSRLQPVSDLGMQAWHPAFNLIATATITNPIARAANTVASAW